MWRWAMSRLTELGACVLLASCASTPPASFGTDQAHWQGRLSVTVHSMPPSSVQAGFVLEGSPTQGTLNLFSPLGTTVASLQWRPGEAQLHQNSQPITYGSMAELTQDALGSALPMEALFDWLHGMATPVAGWQVELSQLDRGKLVARRIEPAPTVVLRLQLD